VNGQRVLEQVLRTQAETARPGFDVDLVLRHVVDEARALTGAQAAEVDLRDKGRIASRAADAHGESSLEVPLPPTAPTPGALTVYSDAGRRFTAEDRQVLELLAGLIGSALTRAALDASSGPND
jgi:GAF domain-containing protein